MQHMRDIRQDLPGKGGFTLIELLVALAVLSVIAVSVSQLFQQSTVAWETGHRRTRTAMLGRAMLDYATEDVRMAAWGGNDASPPSGMEFHQYDASYPFPHATKYVYQSFGGKMGVQRQVTPSTGPGAATNNLLYASEADTLYVDTFDLQFDKDEREAIVALDVTVVEKGRTNTCTFLQRVFLINGDRYYFEN